MAIVIVTDEIFVGDFGAVITMDLQTAIAAVSNIALNVTKPNGVAEEWSPVVVSGTTSLAYTIQDGDLDDVGDYLLQPTCTIGTWTGAASIFQLTVSAVVPPA